VSWFEHGDSKIYYEEEGVGEPLLLLPGWAGTIQELTPLRIALQSKYRVIAADLPGSGKSEPQPRDYTASYFHDDARAFLALLNHLGAEPAHLVGFSDGGEYALVMAVTKPEAVRSIVAWGSAGKMEAPPGMLDAFANLIDAPMEPMKEFAEYLKAAYGEDNARLMLRSFTRALGEIIDAGGDVSRSKAGQIKCPALLITGEHDFLATPALVSDMAGAIPAGEFVEVKDASHPIHHERPDYLIPLIVDWLSKL